ncbi:MAG: EI24 domain-containing protein [Candidatus Parcubacteria bacterium]|nr:EI24 domain-containing protein [Burkholderiales bacterium]
MKKILGSMAFAFFNLLHPRMLWLMIWPVLVAIALWGVVLFVFWTQAALWTAALLQRWIETATLFFSWDAGSVAAFSAKLIMVLMLLPLIQFTALMILGVFGLPAMVEHVASRHYPQLARRQGGSFAGSLWNGLAALGGLALLGVVTLPLWLVPPLWPLIPVMILGWVNQKVLRYDALAEHASADEMREIFTANRRLLYVLGVVLAAIAYLPFLGFFAPVLFGLAFIHYLLGELQARREAPIEGVATRL